MKIIKYFGILLVCGICTYNIYNYKTDYQFSVGVNSIIREAQAQTENGYDPGSCATFSCTVTVISGPMRVYDPITQEWVYVTVETEVAGHYYDCESDGNANICLCDPSCREGGVGSA